MAMDSEWLKLQFRLHPDKNKAGLADALGLGAPAVSKILSGGRQIKAAEYITMRRYFDLPVDGDKGVRPAMLPNHYVVAPMPAAGMEEKETPPPEDSWTIPARLLKPHSVAPDQVRIFTVQQADMAPDFLSGEHVLVNMADVTPSPPGAFLVSDGMGHIIRRCEYVPHSNPPLVKLSAASGMYDSHTLPLKDAGLVGRLIAKLQWL
jgi:hypothetical protein